MSDPIPAIVQHVYQGHIFRNVTVNGEPRFVVADACAAIGLRDVSMALQRVDQASKSQIGVPNANGQLRQTWVVDEPGLYELIIRSDKPEAQAFRRWITREVLPAIKRDGGYILPTATAVQLARLQERIDYSDVRNLLRRATDYDPGVHDVGRMYALMQNDFHRAVTGYDARQLTQVRKDEIQTWTGKRGPTKSDRSNGKNFLTEKELLSEGYLSKIVSARLGLMSMATDYTMRQIRSRIEAIIAEHLYEVRASLREG